MINSTGVMKNSTLQLTRSTVRGKEVTKSPTDVLEVNPTNIPTRLFSFKNGICPEMREEIKSIFNITLN